MIAKKAKYGLKAMFYLAQQYGQGTVLTSQLAEADKIPKKFLEIILLDLKRQGLVHSKMGKGGGYMLSKHPSKIFVGQIVRILDGPLAPISCVSKTAYKRCDECISEKYCGIRRVMMQVRKATANILDKTSLEEACKSELQFKKLIKKTG